MNTYLQLGHETLQTLMFYDGTLWRWWQYTCKCYLVLIQTYSFQLYWQIFQLSHLICKTLHMSKYNIWADRLNNMEAEIILWHWRCKNLLVQHLLNNSDISVPLDLEDKFRVTGNQHWLSHYWLIITSSILKKSHLYPFFFHNVFCMQTHGWC